VRQAAATAPSAGSGSSDDITPSASRHADQGDAASASSVSGSGNGNDNDVAGLRWACGCPDFAQRRLPCKHVRFVWYRALGADPTDASVSGDGAPFFDSLEALVQRLQGHRIASQHTVAGAPASATSGRPRNPIRRSDERVAAVAVAQRPYVGEKCCICYEIMEQADSVYFCETSCGNSVHQECLRVCSRVTGRATCPLCRAPMRQPELQPPRKPRNARATSSNRRRPRF
jgi:hypothetical protein